MNSNIPQAPSISKFFRITASTTWWIAAAFALGMEHGSAGPADPVVKSGLVRKLEGIFQADDFASIPQRRFRVNDHGAKGDGQTVDTAAIQKTIDAAHQAGGGVVEFKAGTYRSGALFVKSHVELHLADDVVIQAIQDNSHYPQLPTRIAGIEMNWPAALINVYEQENVRITSKGVIDGNGAFWWHKFWGKDRKGGMQREYNKRGLRWAVDYDCERVRGIVIWKSKNVLLKDFTLKRPGFWSCSLTYSDLVHVDGLVIRANLGGFGPSSDGINTDSSSNVLVENCDIDCNDDNLCVKAGKDADGLRVNRPTENVVFNSETCSPPRRMLQFTHIMTIPIIDTHQHFIHSDLWPYSWTDGIPALANRRFDLSDYQQAAASTGIQKTLFMESSPDDPHHSAEFQHVCKLAEKPESQIAGIIANCRPEESHGFAAFLDQISQPKLVGLRRILHVMPDELSTTSHFAANLRQLATRNLTFDLCVLARQLPLAIALVKQCENVQFILDHCGVPDIANGVLDPWRSHIAELAKLPNVVCKISGILAYCSPSNACTAAIRPYVEHCLEHFGWDRVVWGGDWPVCLINASLAQWVHSTKEIVQSSHLDDQQKLFHDNAVRIYRLNL